MSVVTFLIGNGFDLACGLKTSFKDTYGVKKGFIDTYDGYLSSEPSSESKAIKRFKDDLKNDLMKNVETWADFEIEFGKYAKNFDNEIELEECVRDYKIYLNEHLKREQKKFHDLCQNNIEKRSDLIGSVSALLFSFFTCFTNNDRGDILSVLNDHNQRILQFINFNYTTVFDELKEVTLEVMAKSEEYRALVYSCVNKPTLHIHGKLDEDVILGVDNDSQLVDLPYELSDFGKEAIIKPTFIEKYDGIRMANAILDINKSNIIVAFGVSLGESDLTWRDMVLDWLKEDPKHHLIFFDHKLAQKNYCKIDVNRKMNDERIAKNEWIKKFFGEIGTDAKSDLFNQIHLPAGTDFFNLETSEADQ